MAGPRKIKFPYGHIHQLLLLYISLLLTTTIFWAPFAVADEQNWLPPGSTTELRDPPPEFIREGTIRDEKWLYGRLLFRSPSLLGEKAVRIGLSCNSCHPNGHLNADFYINGLSDSPGRIDVTHRFWQAGFEDGIFNPIDIPSLRGVRETAPYGTISVFHDLHAFTSHVILTEFAGPSPAKENMEALIAYLNSIDNNGLAGNKNIVHASTDMSYLSLLRTPLEDKDDAKVSELIDLIRSDLGRRANMANAREDALRRTVTSLKEINEKAAAKDFTAALMIHQEMMARQ